MYVRSVQKNVAGSNCSHTPQAAHSFSRCLHRRSRKRSGDGNARASQEDQACSKPFKLTRHGQLKPVDPTVWERPATGVKSCLNEALCRSASKCHVQVLLLCHELLLSLILSKQLMQCLATARPLQQGDRAEQNVPAEMLCEGWLALMLSDRISAGDCDIPC